MKQFYDKYLADVVAVVRASPAASAKLAGICAFIGAIFTATVF